MRIMAGRPLAVRGIPRICLVVGGYMVMALPSMAAGIVGLPFCAVGEYGVSSDKQTIALNAHSVG